jgi:DNA polymerase III subunit epsilon
MRIPGRSVAAASYAAARRPALPTPWREARWCALDLELTGLDPDRDHVIAVGMVPIDEGRVRLGESVYTLVRSRRRSNPQAVLTHKLRVADLAQAPSIDEAVDLILATLTGRVPVFHAAMVERAFLGPLLRRRWLRMPAAADTEALGRLWLSERASSSGGLSLERLARDLGQQAEIPHHALGDAVTTAQAFIALASHLDAAQPQTVGSLTAAGELLSGPRRGT